MANAQAQAQEQAQAQAQEQAQAQAQEQAKPKNVYYGMYQEIKVAAQTPSAVVKLFYNAAMAVNGGAYSEYYKRILGDTKNDFCAEWTPKVVAAFEAQKRCKRYTLFFVWTVVYKQELKDYIKAAKSVAKATANTDGKALEALEALEGLGQAVKAEK